MKYVDGYACVLGIQRLCFESSLSTADWAAWAQALGALVAVAAAYFIGERQGRAQFAAARHAIALQHYEYARTVEYFATSASHGIAFVSKQLASRDDIYRAAESGFASTMREVEALERLLSGIPAYQLPPDVAQCALLLAGAVGQFRLKIASALDWYRSMDDAAFEDFFKSLAEIQQSVDETATSTSVVVERLRKAAGVPKTEAAA